MKEKPNTPSRYSGARLAMAFALLCTLSLVCLVSGDLFFGDIGLIVRRFFLGVFGYTSFVFLLLGIYLGIKSVVGFKVKSKPIKALSVYFFLYALFIIVIVQTALTSPVGATFSGYIKACYNGGYSFESCTAGGALFGMLVHMLSTAITRTGAFVVCAFALAFITFYLFRTPIRSFFERINEKDDGAEEKVKPRKEKPAKKERVSSSPETSSEDVSEADGGDKRAAPILGMGSEFKLKSEKDKRDDEKRESSLKILFGDTSARTGGGKTSYGESYDADMAAKTEYIRKPYDMRGVKVERPMGETDRVDFTPNEETIDMDVDAPDKDVFVIRNEGGRRSSRVGAFDEASGRVSDDYNRDRFTRPGTSSTASRATARTAPVEEPTADTEEKTEGPRVRSGRYDEVRGRSGRTIVENMEEEGNTPNADVLRKLSRTERAKKESGSVKSERSGGISDDGYGATSPRSSETRASATTNGEDYSARRASGEDYSARRADGYSPRTESETSRDGYSPRGSDEEKCDGYSEKADGYGERRRESTFGRDRAADESGVKNDGAERSERVEPTKSAPDSDVEDDNNPIDNIPKNYRFSFPPLKLLNDYKPDPMVLERIKKEQNSRKQIILDILNNPDINAQIVDIKVGPSLTRFEITIPTNVSMRKVTEKYEDLNLWMEARSRIRIIAPIPGTSRIGLEVPNSELATVGLKAVMNTDEFKNAKKSSISFGLGKDMVGKTIIADIAKMPHLLVAGATGTGKSVFLNTLLISLIYKYSPEELRIVLVDPKLVEFSVYEGIPELLFGEIFTEAGEACAMLDWMVAEMGRRYQIFRKVTVRDIDEYNELAEEKGEKKMFRILVLIDEFADLMKQQNDKKRMDTAIGRLAAKARSAGIHIILATQRPTTDIVDGSIKTNFPSRIVFKMSSQTDAIVVMGEAGAEKLLGDGDMMYKVGKMSTIERAQGAFINAREVGDVCAYVRENNKTYYDDRALNSILKAKDSDVGASDEGEPHGGGGGGEDGAVKGAVVEESLIKAAMRIAINGSNVSISMLQRKLGVGYPKAGKIVDVLEARGYISAQVDNNKRKILMTAEQFEQTFGEPL